MQDPHALNYESPRPQSTGGSVGTLQMRSVTTWLIIINVAVFVLNAIIAQRVYALDGWGQRVLVGLRHPIWEWGYFSAQTALVQFQLWRLITFQFLHAGLTHLVFNMIALFFFGPIIETYLGRWRYLAFYLLCGAAGAVSYLLLWMLHVLVTSPAVPLVGASAGIFGVLIAAARIAPNATVLIYGILPMKLKTMAWLFVGIAVYTVFTAGQNAGGEAAHLGGAALGYLLISNPRVLNVFDFERYRRPRMQYRGW